MYIGEGEMEMEMTRENFKLVHQKLYDYREVLEVKVIEHKEYIEKSSSENVKRYFRNQIRKSEIEIEEIEKLISIVTEEIY